MIQKLKSFRFSALAILASAAAHAQSTPPVDTITDDELADARYSLRQETNDEADNVIDYDVSPVAFSYASDFECEAVPLGMAGKNYLFYADGSITVTRFFAIGSNLNGWRRSVQAWIPQNGALTPSKTYKIESRALKGKTEAQAEAAANKLCRDLEKLTDYDPLMDYFRYDEDAGSVHWNGFNLNVDPEPVLRNGQRVNLVKSIRRTINQVRWSPLLKTFFKKNKRVGFVKVQVNKKPDLDDSNNY